MNRAGPPAGPLVSVYTRRRVVLATVVAIVPAAAVLRSAGKSGSGQSSTLVERPPSGTGSANIRPTSPASTAGTIVAVAPTSTPALEHELRFGMSGNGVHLLQQQLAALGFDPGPDDGLFGDATLRSVWAFEKLIVGTRSTAATGLVTAALWAWIFAGIDVRPRRSGMVGPHLEVYLPEQVAVLFVGDGPTLITHISSGEGVEWCGEVVVDNDDGSQSTKGICGKSVTPGGVFHVERKVDGWRNAPLGRLYKPVYFNYGIAVHGAGNVPNRPASHGCVRIPMHIAEYLPDRVSVGDPVYVFDGVKEPEHYGAQLPTFDWADPSATTTTQTTSTSTAAPAPPGALPSTVVAEGRHRGETIGATAPTPHVPT